MDEHDVQSEFVYFRMNVKRLGKKKAVGMAIGVGGKLREDDSTVVIYQVVDEGAYNGIVLSGKPVLDSSGSRVDHGSLC